jgi:hypothetical protein
VFLDCYQYCCHVFYVLNASKSSLIVFSVMIIEAQLQFYIALLLRPAQNGVEILSLIDSYSDLTSVRLRRLPQLRLVALLDK